MEGVIFQNVVGFLSHDVSSVEDCVFADHARVVGVLFGVVAAHRYIKSKLIE